MSAIRTAILGYGRNGSTMHGGALEANADFDVVAVCDTSSERREEAASRFGCKTYSDHHRMLQDEELDLVCVVSRSDQHCPMTCDCLSAGADVMVTKPWGLNVDEAKQMVEASERTGRLLLPWLPARWGCDFLRLQQLVEEKAIGNVFMIRRAVCGFAARDDWQTELRYGGGYLLNWGLHLVDPPILLGGGEVDSVYGRLKKAINAGDGDDQFLALINLANGTLVQAEYTVAVDNLPDWFVQGDRGTIVVRDRALKVFRKDPTKPDDPTDYSAMEGSEGAESEETLEGEIYGDEHEIYRLVSKAIRREAEYPVSHAEVLSLTGLLDAIRISDRENRVVEM